MKPTDYSNNYVYFTTFYNATKILDVQLHTYHIFHFLSLNSSNETYKNQYLDRQVLV